MKLKLRIAFYFIFSLALLRFTLSRNQAFDKIDRESRFSKNKSSNPTKGNFIIQNNIMDFFQKVIL